MIEIIFGHKVRNGVCYQSKLSVGHGIPEYGQTDFITLIEEEINMSTGGTLWATMRWHFSFPIVFKKPYRTFKMAMRYWYPRRLTLKCNPRVHAWLWWNF